LDFRPARRRKIAENNIYRSRSRQLLYGKGASPCALFHLACRFFRWPASWRGALQPAALAAREARAAPARAASTGPAARTPEPAARTPEPAARTPEPAAPVEGPATAVWV